MHLRVITLTFTTSEIVRNRLQFFNVSCLLKLSGPSELKNPIRTGAPSNHSFVAALKGLFPMHLLFALPVEIWQENILQFIALVDIIRAGSAFYNWKVQSQFQYLIDELTLQASMSVLAGQAKQITWFLKRNILSRSLLVTGKLDEYILSILPRICA